MSCPLGAPFVVLPGVVIVSPVFVSISIGLELASLIDESTDVSIDAKADVFVNMFVGAFITSSVLVAATVTPFLSRVFFLCFTVTMSVMSVTLFVVVTRSFIVCVCGSRRLRQPSSALSLAPTRRRAEI